jgi:prepilin-type N-terminal cleavage/methylation domain-containing protein
MKMKMTSDKWQAMSAGSFKPQLVARHSSLITRAAFTLIEVLVVVTLMSLIVLALMAVFNGTQTAFRSGVTQSGVLEDGRSTLDLMAQDLREMAVAGSPSNANVVVNFYAVVPGGYTPLVQSLTASANDRVNVLEGIFVLGRENQKWTGTGYIVNAGSTDSLYPLYRFYAEADIRSNPRRLFDSFTNEIATLQWTNMSHLMDGVVHLTARPYDANGYWITNTYQFYAGQWHTNTNVSFFAPQWGEVGLYMFSNTLPASVEIQLGVLEDRTLQRAATWPNGSLLQSNYLAGKVGQLHLFRQHILIPNVDRSVYQ